MNNPKQWWIETKIEQTIAALEKNNMSGYFAKTAAEVDALLISLIPPQSTVSVGGSQTLFEVGVLELLRAGDYTFLDRYAEGLTPEDIKALYRQSFSADVYLTSTNAITESGELFNVDGTGNRVAAMIYGPDRVIVICGYNKIVKDVDAAIERLKQVAAPMNVNRLSRKTPCAELGYCTDCSSPDRICNAYTLIKKQGRPGRIHVILVGESLGF